MSQRKRKSRRTLDPSDERQIICDEKLKELFHVETHRGIGVMELLSPHFIKAEG